MHQTTEAAAVLLMSELTAGGGRKILGFRRSDNDATGLPCGRIAPGEIPAQAAVRELAEETGYAVEIDTKTPYVAFDNRGGMVVHTFIATQIISQGAPTHPFEGTPVWVSARELTDDRYGVYNRGMFAHFGVDPRPIAGKFHSHLTLRASHQEAERARDLVGGKVTVIDLERGVRGQTDIMLTHHYVCGKRGLQDIHDVQAQLLGKANQLRACGIDVTRVKLEHELLDERSDPRDIDKSIRSGSYTEVHVKTLVSVADQHRLVEAAAGMNWHPSRNPFSVREEGIVQFVNRRFYHGEGEEHWDLGTIAALTDALVSEIRGLVHILEIKTETAVYDSNDALDRWWVA